MKYIPRVAEKKLLMYLKAFPVVGIMGPRQSGKSTMIKQLLSKDYTYISFDDFKVSSLFYDDPEKFFRIYSNNIIIDEVQKAPEIFNYIKLIVDNNRKKYGNFVLTGSGQFLLQKHITESLAGRIGLISLLPFQFSEVPKKLQSDSIFKGSFPEQIMRNFQFNDDWYSSYIETYLNKDLKQMSNIGDTRDFRRFIQLLSFRVGQILNLSDIAKDIGVSVNTLKRWLSILEASYVVFLLPPFYENMGKRIIKSPKIYFYDTGLISFFSGIENNIQYEKSPFNGNIFENYIISEVLKYKYHTKSKMDLYYFRTNHGQEIDLLVDYKNQLDFVEIKASESFKSQMISSIASLKPEKSNGYLVYQGVRIPYTDKISILNYKEFFSEQFK